MAERPVSGQYDVIIAGASFAGLACARAIQERTTQARILVVDRYPPGAHQTSACAVPRHVIERVGATSSILQLHRDLWVHTPAGSSRWRLPAPYCTVDYAAFCREVLGKLDVEFIRSPVLGVQDSTAIFPFGRIRARVLVDATGWRAAMASSLDPLYVRRRGRWMGVGVEVELPRPWQPGLHFYFDSSLVRGYAWAFGCGATTRFGVASDDLRAPVKEALLRFLEKIGIPGAESRGRPLHGGRLASGLREPVVGPVFVVGDAAGQCLPATGEGIRPAIWAGLFLGHLLANTLSGQVSLCEAKSIYRRYHHRNRRLYLALAGLQAVTPLLPVRAFLALARLLERPAWMDVFMAHYLHAMLPGRCCRPLRPAA